MAGHVVCAQVGGDALAGHVVRAAHHVLIQAVPRGGQVLGRAGPPRALHPRLCAAAHDAQRAPAGVGLAGRVARPQPRRHPPARGRGSARAPGQVLRALA